MKVILLQELKGRGGEGDVVEVAQGFAVNYLLPRKIAIEATKGNLKQLGQRRTNIEEREQGRMSDAEKLAAALDGKVVTVGAKVGEEGRLFGSVTTTMIEKAIGEQLGVEVDHRKIDARSHIKEIGPHVVGVSVYRDIKAQVTVEVVAEGQVAPHVPTTVVVEVEGVAADGGAFVEVVEETPEQALESTALDEATAQDSGDLASADESEPAEQTEAE